MRRTIFSLTAIVLAAGWLTSACSGQGETESDETPEPAAAAEPEPSPDPSPEEAEEVEAFVREWVAEHAGEGDVFDIPPRGGHEVSGTLSAFHAVQRGDAESYSVCVDFQDGENAYDVDFFLARGEEGLTLSEHYLHKVNGEAVEADQP